MESPKQIKLFNELILCVNPDDWDFMCKNRFGTDNPPYDEVQAEFVTGTGITQNRRDLWSEADSRFAEYINDLKELYISNLNRAARDLLDSKEKSVCI